MNARGFGYVFLSALLASIPALVGCRENTAPAATGEASQLPTAAPGTSAPPTLEELANALYHGVADEPVQLVDGHWEGEPFVEGGAARPTVGLIEDFRLTGDLDGDGEEEAVALLWTSSGGSGTFDYLAVMDRSGEEVVEFGTAALGDRVKVRGARIVDDRIEIDVLEAGPDDAACCPSQMARRAWALQAGELIEVDSQVTGKMSLSELEGIEWVLTELDRHEPAPPQLRVTVQFEGGRVAGHAGCNRYFTRIAEGETPGAVSIGPVGSTKKLCPDPIMQVEDRFLAQLGAVTQYSFFAGKLLLSWQAEGSMGAMLFRDGGPLPEPPSPAE